MSKYLLVIATLLCCFCAHAVNYECDFFTADGLGYRINSDGTVTLQDALGPDEDNPADITNLVVPETVNHDGKTYTVTGIGSYVFVPFLLSCDYQDFTYSPLKSVTIPSTVKYIDDYAFVDCISLETVDLGEGVERIGKAFSGCKSLKNIFLPKSLKEISGKAFLNTAIAAYDIDSTNPYLSVVDGVLYNKTITKLISYPTVKAGSFTVPQSVTTLCDFAFMGCKKLTSLTINNSVTSIGICLLEFSNVEHVALPNSIKTIPSSMCADCVNLKSIEIPESVTTIDHAAFADCTSLASVTMGENVDTINTYAFVGCTELREISTNARYIDLYSFYDCDNLESVHFGKACNNISFDRFVYSKSIKSITVSPENPHYKIVGGCLVSTANNKFVGALNRNAICVAIPEGTTEIGTHAFLLAGETQLVYIPKTVTHFGNYAFQHLPAKVAVFNDAVALQSTEKYTFTGLPTDFVMFLHGDAYNSATRGSAMDVWKCHAEQYNQTADINGDHFIDVADLNQMIDLILFADEISGNQLYDYPDLDHDGKIDVSDINLMIDRIINPSHILFYEPFEQENAPLGCSMVRTYLNSSEIYGGTTDNYPYFTLLTYDDGTPAKKGVCLNGATTSPGLVRFESIYTPTNRFTFKYGDPYNTNNYSFKVEIKDKSKTYQTLVVNADSEPGAKTFACDYQTAYPATIAITILSQDPNCHVAIWDAKMYK